jgi:hypothetical protein
MNGNYVMIAKAYIKNEAWEKAKLLWENNYLQANYSRVVYERAEEYALLEIIALPDMDDMANIIRNRHDFINNAKQFMRSDWHITVLQYMEDLKPTVKPVPTSHFIELRHIEVPLSIYEEYKQWREKTIYRVLKPKKEIEVFSYYHTILGEKPGVYFIVGFSTDIPSYTGVYQEPEYQEILRQAGQNYITGGLAGLSTEIYKKLS